MTTDILNEDTKRHEYLCDVQPQVDFLHGGPNDCPNYVKARIRPKTTGGNHGPIRLTISTPDLSAQLVKSMEDADGAVGGGTSTMIHKKGSQSLEYQIYGSEGEESDDATFRRFTSDYTETDPSGAFNRSSCTCCRKHPSRPTAILVWVLTAFASAHLLLSALSHPGPLIAHAEGGTATLVVQLGQRSNQTATVPLKAGQLERVRNYRAGTGLILHLHLTHHGGTSFCFTVGAASGRRSPSFACRIDSHVDQLDPALTRSPRFTPRVPWHSNETQTMIELIRPFYHMISFEFGFQRPPFSLQETDWEDPNLLSVFITRHPLERLLAGDGYVSTHYNIYDKNATIDDWWDYANSTSGLTDNFMLRVLSNTSDCCQGFATPPQRLQEAMDLLSRLTFILDIECLDEGMEALASILGLDVGNSMDKNSRGFHSKHPPLESRFPFPSVYEFLLERNKLDIELYTWTRQRSLVDCAALRT